MHNRALWRSIIIALVFLCLAVTVNYYAAIYASSHASNPVTDIILSNVRAFDVEPIFVFGPIVFWIIAGLYMLIRTPFKIPFALKSVGLLILVRAFFITLTHIAPFPDQTNVSADFMGLFSSGADLFFSDHTALPFLVALVFWDNLRMRVFCILSSIFFGIVVLLGHMHYSIDVAAAFFITYTTFHMAAMLFKKDFVLSRQKVAVRVRAVAGTVHVPVNEEIEVSRQFS